ncbi:beta-lactamase [Stenotrophomonas terrae]|uniref:Beta-lactamase n=2 Tax=Stenotrophomonas terrae TaxID=405446 RepID=A0A0R0D4D0_9GAMM|nr:beta-lactamase [Stenotrophomonas terrae]
MSRKFKQGISHIRWSLLVILATGFIGPVLASDPRQEIDDALTHGLRPAVLPLQAPLPHWSLAERMAQHSVPGTSVAVIRDGKLVYARGFGTRQAGSNDPVDADTLFSVGSVSKVVTAAVTLREVADGKLNLDRSVNGYLHSWKIPAGAGVDPDTISLRMLMSHTAGLGVWGFEDYQPGETLPTLLQTLNGESPAKNAAVRIQFPPGSRMLYSGGGVTIEQLLLQDTSGKSFAQLADERVFSPVGMSRSTFINPLPADTRNVAHAHDKKGQATALPRGWESFPEQAASGLWTSANDLGHFVAALLSAYRGQGPFLPQSLAIAMMTEVAPSQHGLGPRLEGEGRSRVFHHGGSNDSYRAWIEGYPASGDGFVILTNGANGARLAAELRNALTDLSGDNQVLRTIELPTTTLADFEGDYLLTPDLPGSVTGSMTGYFDHDRFRVAVADDTLVVSQADDNPRRLQPLTPTRFVNPAGDASQPRFEFLRGADGKVQGLRVQRDGGQLHFHKLQGSPSQP